MGATLSTKTSSKPRKRRDRNATLAAVLHSARVCFSADSYDHVSLRQIASFANVDVAAVARAYGSKEDLFRAAVVGLLHYPEMLAKAPKDKLADAILDMLLGKGPEYDITLSVIRSANVSPAREMLREGLEERFVAPLATAIDEDDATLRAELLNAITFGFGAMRDVVKTSELRSAEVEHLRRLLRPILVVLIGGGGDHEAGALP